MAVTKVGGITYIQVNGNQYPLRGTATATLGNIEAEAVVGNDAFHGIKELPKEASIEIEFTDLGSLSVSDLEAMDDVTVTAQCNNGKTAVLYNARQVNQIAVDLVEGKYTAKFIAKQGQWI